MPRSSLPARWTTALALLLVLTRLASAQATGGVVRVSGVVFDSIAGAPLAGASVQLADAVHPASGLRSTTSDAKGRYEIDSVPLGRYLIAFHHPVIDSLGLEEPTYQIEIREPRPMEVELAVPSAARIIAAYCGPPTPGDSSGVLLGTLQDARKLGVVGGGKVVARWAEITFDKTGLHEEVRQVGGTSTPTGWFFVCGVPTGTDVQAYATHDADTSGTIAVHIPLDGIGYRNFYLGAAERVALATTDSMRDSVHADSGRADSAATGAAAHVQYALRGPARITGTVLTDHGQPLAGAHVSVLGTHVVATTNERGAFVITDAPEGTQMLATRALGYFPDDRPVDVLEENMPAVEVRLATTRSVLDTMRIAGKRVLNQRFAEFERRQRSGLGRYFDQQAIERIHPLETTDLFNRTASMHITPSSTGYQLRVRGQTCLPMLYLNGMPIQLLEDLKEIDMFVRPEEIQGIEMYTAGEAPMQYSPRGSCAVIIVWTKP